MEKNIHFVHQPSVQINHIHLWFYTTSPKTLDRLKGSGCLSTKPPQQITSIFKPIICKNQSCRLPSLHCNMWGVLGSGTTQHLQCNITLQMDECVTLQYKILLHLLHAFLCYMYALMSEFPFYKKCKKNSSTVHLIILTMQNGSLASNVMH